MGGCIKRLLSFASFFLSVPFLLFPLPFPFPPLLETAFWRPPAGGPQKFDFERPAAEVKILIVKVAVWAVFRAGVGGPLRRAIFANNAGFFEHRHFWNWKWPFCAIHSHKMRNARARRSKQRQFYAIPSQKLSKAPASLKMKNGHFMRYCRKKWHLETCLWATQKSYSP